MLGSEARAARLRLITDEEHYHWVIEKLLREARVSLFLSTANAKDLRVEAPVGTRERAAGRHVSLLEILASKVRAGVDVRFLHAGLPSRPFRKSLSAHPELEGALRKCPRVHLKMIAKDGELLYLGSANFTGAGLGARGVGRRNFELGVVTDDHVLLDRTQERFDRIWRGAECAGCKLRRVCPEPIDLLEKRLAPRKKPAPKR